jgi:DNA-binding transcriptional ArsR family regulator
VNEADQVLESVASFFALLAEPSRLKVLHAICTQERSVGEVVAQTGLTQSNVSRQLRGLHARGLVSRRKEGNMVFYKVTDGTLVELCRAVCARIAGQIDERRPLKKALREFMTDPARAARRAGR